MINRISRWKPYGWSLLKRIYVGARRLTIIWFRVSEIGIKGRKARQNRIVEIITIGKELNKIILYINWNIKSFTNFLQKYVRESQLRVVLIHVRKGGFGRWIIWIWQATQISEILNKSIIFINF